MGRWTQYDGDEYRLPEGMKRIGYDADTGRYYFRDRAGIFYRGPQGSRFGQLTRVPNLPIAVSRKSNGVNDVKAAPSRSDGHKTHLAPLRWWRHSTQKVDRKEILDSRQRCREGLFPGIRDSDEIVAAFETLNLEGNEWLAVPAVDAVLYVGLAVGSLLGFHFSSSNALFNMTANPQYLQPLREEVDAIIKQEGRSKVALVEMREVDSFLRETQRLEGIESG
ncbi:hypothetical protein BJ138DRAFT_1116085 [Hygrophoropsis aurantiaca]|uniref:Uncharacterized protein n=1 Tax=Hygrophoropsis aurantiaca TaxID=72124 RepID=A0ACB8A4Z7_9AGAM|nr:hypothetical protein BJ138DRAFT_1116085 [Hygrophoropsis aurantiaca]